MDFVEKQVILKFISVTILIFLCLAVYIHGQGLKCENCQISFTASSSVQAIDAAPKLREYYVNITDLYYPFLNNTCLIAFNEHGGFIENVRINK